MKKIMLLFLSLFLLSACAPASTIKAAKPTATQTASPTNSVVQKSEELIAAETDDEESFAEPGLPGYDQEVPPSFCDPALSLPGNGITEARVITSIELPIVNQESLPLELGIKDEEMRKILADHQISIVESFDEQENPILQGDGFYYTTQLILLPEGETEEAVETELVDLIVVSNPNAVYSTLHMGDDETSIQEELGKATYTTTFSQTGIQYYEYADEDFFFFVTAKDGKVSAWGVRRLSYEDYRQRITC